MIAVTGATGTVGRRVVARLVAAGHDCRAVVRDAATARSVLGPRAQIVTGDLARPGTLDVAFAGVRRLFLLAPDIPGAEKLEIEANAIDAAKRAGVRHIVYLSAALRDREPQFAIARYHRTTERKIEQSGLAWTHVRPIAFMSNVLLSLDTIKTDGAIYLPTANGKVSCVDPDDIAAVATAALTGDRHEGKAYTLTGPQALSYAEQAQQLSAVLGSHITHVDVPAATAREAMLTAGASPALVEDLLEYYALVKAGERALISPDFERVVGHQPRTFATYVRQNAAAFQ